MNAYRKLICRLGFHKFKTILKHRSFRGLVTEYPNERGWEEVGGGSYWADAGRVCICCGHRKPGQWRAIGGAAAIYPRG